MSLVDFEQFPATEPERLALLRFRLRKTVPFHIEEAQLSYSIQLSEPNHVEVLAVVIAKPILDEYESLLRATGYRVGVVTPSSVAVLPLCVHASQGVSIVAKVAGTTLTLLLISEGRVRLVRCIDLADETQTVPSGDEYAVMPALQQTIAYAEDELKQSPQRLFLCGFGNDTEALGSLAQQEFGLGYAPLRSRFGAASQLNAGLLGMLEQYA
jgi:type IV pilus assembly protein PilM